MCTAVCISVRSEGLSVVILAWHSLGRMVGMVTQNMLSLLKHSFFSLQQAVAEG